MCVHVTVRMNLASTVHFFSCSAAVGYVLSNLYTEYNHQEERNIMSSKRGASSLFTRARTLRVLSARDL